MIYTALDVALVAMLAVVTVYAGVLHRELRRFRSASRDYAGALAQTAKAVENVEGAVRGIQEEAGAVLVALGEQIDRAGRALDALKAEAASQALAAAAARQAISLQERAAEPIRPAPARLREPAPAPRAPEPQAPPAVRAPKAHQWPTVRLAAQANPA